MYLNDAYLDMKYIVFFFVLYGILIFVAKANFVEKLWYSTHGRVFARKWTTARLEFEHAFYDVTV